ncbi:hypothetical protein HGI79_15790 [Clostridium sp. DJ247]|nr:hypothetical protein [Clostridium sp. DJ247]
MPPKSQAKNFIDVSGLTINADSLKTCMHKLIYIWFRDGINFWAWISFIGGGHAAGWRWNSQNWIKFEIDLRKVDTFICYE